jgi:hypothetical protein
MAKSKKFRKVARIEDRTTGKVVERIAFPKPNGVIGAIELPPSVIHDRRSFERHLRDVGAKLPRDRKVLSALLEQLANEKPEAFQVYAPRCGWTTDDRAYVQLQSVIGSPLEKIVGIKPVDSCKRRKRPAL